MKTGILVIWLSALLMFVVFPAEGMAKGVSLALNMDSFSAGDGMEVKCAVNAADISAQRADVYFVLTAPDAAFYCMNADGIFESNVISAVLSDWPIVDTASTTLFAFDFSAGIPSGIYTWYLVLCEPGKDIAMPDNRLAGDSYQWKFTDSNATEIQELQSEQQRDDTPDISDTELDRLVTANSGFAVDLYQKIRGGAGNLFYSPYSISLALAMTYAGAKNETQNQMADTLHFIFAGEQLHSAFNALAIELTHRGEGAQAQDGQKFSLNIANAIWAQTGYSFLPEFLDILAENYGAGLKLLDFMKAPEDSRICINRWISDETEAKIKDLIPKGSITTLTKLVLTNAIYFNAAWLSPFDENNTRQDGIFHLADNTRITVPMMSQTGYFKYAAGDGYQAVELPYDGREFSMLIFLPEPGGFEKFEASLDAGQVDMDDNLCLSYLHLTMPRFEYEFSLGLRKALKAMGMKDAFNAGVADFSGMDGTYALYIDDIIHKAFISVNEAGTEAAAATAVIMSATAIPQSPAELALNRPFIFFIRDVKTGTILFAGRILNPGE